MVELAAQDTTLIRQVYGAVGDLASRILDYAIALAAVGALAMALIEAVKKLFDLRTTFHARRWTHFMKEASATLDESTRVRAFEQLLQLATGVSGPDARTAAADLLNGKRPARQQRPYAVFAQDAERMVAIMQDAVDTALASPRTYSRLFRFITIGANRRDVRLWLRLGSGEPPADANEARDGANALGRLRQIARQKLIGFQLYTEQTWASRNQLWANVVGAAIMMLALLTLAKVSVPTFIILSALGGIVSPVAKDLVTALQRVKDAPASANT